MPRITVAPASPSARTRSTIAWYRGFPCHVSDSPTKMRSNRPSPSIFISHQPPERDATQHRDDAGRDAPEKVRGTDQIRAVLPQPDGFEHQRRERGVRAEET